MAYSPQVDPNYGTRSVLMTVIVLSDNQALEKGKDLSLTFQESLQN